MAEALDLFEDELLELAGRKGPASSGSKKRSKRAAHSDDDDDSDLLGLSDEEDERAASGKKGKRKPASKKQRASAREEEEDDDDDHDGDGSDLYIDEEDRRKLEAMTEFEREMILADRAEERDKVRQRKEILKKARETEKAGQKGSSRLSGRQKKAASDKDQAIKQIEAARKRQGKGKGKARVSSARDWSDDEDDGIDDDEEEEEDDEEEEDEPEYQDSEEEEEGSKAGKKKGSSKKGGKGKRAAAGSDDEEEGEEEGEGKPGWRATTRSGAAAAAAQERSQRGPGSQRGAAALDDDEEEEEGAAEPTRGMRREAYAADDDDEAPEGRPGRGKGASAMQQDEDEEEEELADSHELRQIQLTRTQLEAMFDKPFFEGEGLTGALVRMAYGPPTKDKDGRMTPCYWMMQVVSIKEGGSSYPFGPKGLPCNKKLELRDGLRTVRVLPMSNASNQPLEDAEIERFARHAGRINERPIGKQQVAEVKRKIQDAVNYRWDSAQIKDLVRRKKEAGGGANVAFDKQNLKRLLEGLQAKQERTEEEDAEMAKLEAQIRMIDERLEQRVQKDRSTGMSSINQRNKDANFSNTIRNVSNRPLNSAVRKGGGGDPFSRRETRPNIYWNTTNATQQQEAQAAAGGTPTKAPADKAPGSASKALKPSMQRLDPSALMKVLDLDIDVRPLQGVSLVPPLHMRLLGPRWHQSLRAHATADLTGKNVFTLRDWNEHLKAGAGDGMVQ